MSFIARSYRYVPDVQSFPLDCQPNGWSLVGMGFPPDLATSIPTAIPAIVPSSRRLLSEHTGGSTPALFEESPTLTLSSRLVGAIPSLIPLASFERAPRYRHTTTDDGMKSGKRLDRQSVAVSAYPTQAKHAHPDREPTASDRFYGRNTCHRLRFSAQQAFYQRG